MIVPSKTSKYKMPVQGQRTCMKKVFVHTVTGNEVVLVTLRTRAGHLPERTMRVAVRLRAGDIKQPEYKPQNYNVSRIVSGHTVTRNEGVLQ